MDNPQKQNYEIYLENTLPKIRLFLWSDAYSVLIKSIAKPYKLTEAQVTAFKDVVFDIIIGYLSEAEAKNKLNEAGIPQSNQEKLFLLAHEYIIAPLLAEVEDTPLLISDEEDEELEGIAAPEVQNDSKKELQDTVLQNITHKLQKTTVIAPSKRSHTVEKTTETKTPHTDPYREIPE